MVKSWPWNALKLAWPFFACGINDSSSLCIWLKRLCSYVLQNTNSRCPALMLYLCKTKSFLNKCVPLYKNLFVVFFDWSSVYLSCKMSQIVVPWDIFYMDSSMCRHPAIVLHIFKKKKIINCNNDYSIAFVLWEGAALSFLHRYVLHMACTST